ncbi:MAG: complex I subunit 4 family protein [Candidatus Dormibacteria bacterium]
MPGAGDVWSAAHSAAQARGAWAAFRPLLAASQLPAALPVTSPAPSATSPAAAASNFELPSLLLSSVVWLTTLAAIAIFFMPERTDEQRGRIRSLSLLASGAAAVLTLFTLATAVSLGVAATPDQLHEENSAWIATFPFSIHYHLSADGVTLSLLTLSTVLFGCVLLASWKRRESVRMYCGLLLLLETAVNGALCATDLVMFVLFFVMQALPLYLLVRRFGGEGRERAARRLAVTVLVAAALLTVSFLIVVVHSKAHSSDLDKLLSPNLGGTVATTAFWLTVVAFALSFSVVPLHGWMVDAQRIASSGVAAIVAGVVVRLGGYGMVRYALGLFPAEAQHASGALMVLAVISALWGCLLGLRQPTLRRLVSTLSIVQMSLVMLAISAPNSTSLTGAVIQLVAGGFSTGLLLMLCGIVEGRARSGAFTRLGGLAAQAPRLSAFWIVACLAAAGAPLLAGFTAEVLIFDGVAGLHPAATLLVMAALLVSTGALLNSVRRTFFGPAREELARFRDTGALELGYLWPAVVFLVLFGVFAGRFLPAVATGLTRIAAAIGGTQ